MSDKKKSLIGIGFILLAVAIPFASLLFRGKDLSIQFEGKHLPDPELCACPVLSDTAFLNMADSEQLTALPGIGEIIAGKVVQERADHGVFHYPEDLTSVSGIGNAKLRKLIPIIENMD